MSSESKLALLSRARRIKRQFVVYSLDLAAFALSTILAFELRFDGALPAQYFHPMAAALCIWAEGCCHWVEILGWQCAVKWQLKHQDSRQGKCSEVQGIHNELTLDAPRPV